MINVVIVALAVALVCAVLDSLISILELMLPPKLVNLVLGGGFSYLGLYLLEPDAVKVLIVKSLAACFISRVALVLAERASTYRNASIKLVP